jgi:flagellar FliJ protein
MAARFKFRLEGLLKLRRSLEEEAQRELARMIALGQAAAAKLEELRRTQADTVDGRRLAPNQVVDLERLRATERYLLVVERRIQWAEQELREAEQRVAEARLALVKAHQDHLMLQRLKERRLEQHNQERQLEEVKDMDEIAVLRHRLGRPNAPSHPEVAP